MERFFSDTVNLEVPANWSELSDRKLAKLYGMMASGLDADALKLAFLMKFSGLKYIGRVPDGSQSRRAWLEGKHLFKFRRRLVLLSAVQLAELFPELDWLEKLPLLPVRPKFMRAAGLWRRKRRGLSPTLADTPFSTYLQLENLYQGYLATTDDRLLDRLAAVLYPGLKGRLRPADRIAVFYWMATLKEFFARRYPDFFRPLQASDSGRLGASDAAQRAAVNAAEGMDAQIRALTKGDVTKEAVILKLDTWRALTELNAQAREYEQLNQKLKQ